MKCSLSLETVETITSWLRDANVSFNLAYPFDAATRQPVHTVYAGAQIYKFDSVRKIGELALRSLQEYAPDFVTFARALQLPGHDTLPAGQDDINALQAMLYSNPADSRNLDFSAWLASTVYTRLVKKLQREPVEDLRIDFEDGFGYRSNEEEDSWADKAALEMLRAAQENALPASVGIRIKPLNEESKARAIRTLDIFLTSFLSTSQARRPERFIITLPKVTITQQVTALVELLENFEGIFRLPRDYFQIEIMLENTQAVLNQRGEVVLPQLIEAARGRCSGVHFGIYDFTASADITVDYQSPDHPYCDFARHIMKTCLAQRGVFLSDGAVNLMPIGPHRASEGATLTEQQWQQNASVVHHAWRTSCHHISRSLQFGIYQGWDLHPAQIPARFAALYTFFLMGLEGATLRLRHFLEKSAQATLTRNTFDDAASGQGLLNFFLRGLSCGALTEAEAIAPGLSLEELRTRSFPKIITQRRKQLGRA